jgi:hypothetical protein
VGADMPDDSLSRKRQIAVTPWHLTALSPQTHSTCPGRRLGVSHQCISAPENKGFCDFRRMFRGIFDGCRAPGRNGLASEPLIWPRSSAVTPVGPMHGIAPTTSPHFIMRA